VKKRDEDAEQDSTTRHKTFVRTRDGRGGKPKEDLEKDRKKKKGRGTQSSRLRVEKENAE